MSSMQYITSAMHVITNSEFSAELAGRIAHAFSDDEWDADEWRESVEEDGEFTEVRVYASGFDLDDALSSFEEVLGEVASLENGGKRKGTPFLAEK